MTRPQCRSMPKPKSHCRGYPEAMNEVAMKPTRTWIVIADGSRAHILLNEGPDKPLSFVPGSDFRHASPPNREIYTERAR